MEKEEQKNKGFYLAGFLLVVAAVILVIVFLMRGETRTYGEYADPESNESISCELEGFQYPFFTRDGADSKLTKIKISFYNRGIKSISLTQILSYSSDELAAASSTINHAAMNNSFSNILGADALGANYNVSDGKMRFTIYVDEKDYNQLSKKYFLVNGDPGDIDDFAENYAEQGFDCIKIK